MYDRIVIVGLAGSGKSTLASSLAKKLESTHIELDALHWEPNWQEAPNEVMLERVKVALPESGRWVVDGNYKAMRDVTWGRAQAVIWLDYPLGFIMMRLIWRTISRIVWGTELWNGNRENIWNHMTLDTNENLFLWNIKMFTEFRKRYEDALREPQYSHLRMFRMRNAADTAKLLEAIPASDASD